MRRLSVVSFALAFGLAVFGRPMHADFTQAPQAPAAPAVLQSEETNITGIVAEIVECKRADGVLSIKMRLRNTTPAAISVNVIEGKNFDHYYVIAGTKKYFVLRDSEGTPLAPAIDIFGKVNVSVPRNGSWTWWAKYPAPPDTEKTISYYTPLAPPIEAIPISG
ncbi:MAG TPA: hypothetical protein VLT86_06365 [Vicinamibacterales bacterium]|nr:hypothetical protein [Vicinamibacterales bacterium]